MALLHEIGTLIKRRRIELDMTQALLARATAHIGTLLDEASPSLLVRLVDEVSKENNLAPAIKCGIAAIWRRRVTCSTIAPPPGAAFQCTGL